MHNLKICKKIGNTTKVFSSKLEIENIKSTFAISVLKVEATIVGFFFLISNFFPPNGTGRGSVHDLLEMTWF